MHILSDEPSVCILINISANYADDIVLLANTPNQAESLLHSLERAASGICLHVNADKADFMCFNQRGNLSTVSGDSLKLEDKFTYLGSSVSSTENDTNTQLAKAWTAIDRLSIILKSDLSDEIKGSFFLAAVVSILLYGYTIWTLTKRMEKNLDSNCIRMLRAILNTSWRQHLTKQQLYGYLPSISKTIPIRRTRHVGHCWRSKDEFISDIFLWTSSQRRACVGWPAWTYLQQLCTDKGCSLEDLPGVMNDRDEWQERIKEITSSSMLWWWCCWWCILYMH